MPLSAREFSQIEAAINGMAAVSRQKVERCDWKAGGTTESVQAIAAPDVLRLIETFVEIPKLVEENVLQ